MVGKIHTCLWFDNNASQAVKFYKSVFGKVKTGMTIKYDEEGAKASGQKKGSLMTIEFELFGQTFLGLNGGPVFKFNPSISFFVYCDSVKEVDTYYKKISKGAEIMMPLDKYPFSDRYVFLKDKFGVSWQIMLHPRVKDKIAPCLLFVGDNCGNAKKAIELYTKVFKVTKISQMVYYKKDDAMGNRAGTVMHAVFTLFGKRFIAMDGAGPHKFEFNDATSFIVYCKDQKEIDYYWNSFLKSGGREEQCGWIRDKFGVAWQIVPVELGKYLNGKDKIGSKRATKAMFSMKKFDIKGLEKAYKGK